jgi:hypothetical protein
VHLHLFVEPIQPGAFAANVRNIRDKPQPIRPRQQRANARFAAVVVSGNDGNDVIQLYGTWTKAKVFGGSGYDRVKRYGNGLIELNGVELLE